MEEMTVEDVISALEVTSTAILACGGTEQHGYHLPLSTDYLTAYEVSKSVSDLTGCLVLPPLCYSYSGGKLPGTTDISPETTTQVVTEIGLSLTEQGVKNIILFAGHCGTEHLNALKDAGHRIMDAAPGIRVAYVPILSLSKSWVEMLGGGGEHAGKGETSLILHLRPDLVADDRPVDTDETRTPAPPRVEPTGKPYLVDEFVLDPLEKRVVIREANYKYGVGGPSPNEATAEIGKILVDEMVNTLAKLVRELEG
jgi:creatinine amidohydrolase